MVSRIHLVLLWQVFSKSGGADVLQNPIWEAGHLHPASQKEDEGALSPVPAGLVSGFAGWMLRLFVSPDSPNPKLREPLLSSGCQVQSLQSL